MAEQELRGAALLRHQEREARLAAQQKAVTDVLEEKLRALAQHVREDSQLILLLTGRLMGMAPLDAAVAVFGTERAFRLGDRCGLNGQLSERQAAEAARAAAEAQQRAESERRWQSGSPAHHPRVIEAIKAGASTAEINSLIAQVTAEVMDAAAQNPAPHLMASPDSILRRQAQEEQQRRDKRAEDQRIAAQRFWEHRIGDPALRAGTVQPPPQPDQLGMIIEHAKRQLAEAEATPESSPDPDDQEDRDGQQHDKALLDKIHGANDDR